MKKLFITILFIGIVCNILGQIRKPTKPEYIDVSNISNIYSCNYCHKNKIEINNNILTFWNGNYTNYYKYKTYYKYGKHHKYKRTEKINKKTKHEIEINYNELFKVLDKADSIYVYSINNNIQQDFSIEIGNLDNRSIKFHYEYNNSTKDSCTWKGYVSITHKFYISFERKDIKEIQSKPFGFYLKKEITKYKKQLNEYKNNLKKYEKTNEKINEKIKNKYNINSSKL